MMTYWSIKTPFTLLRERWYSHKAPKLAYEALSSSAGIALGGRPFPATLKKSGNGHHLSNLLEGVAGQLIQFFPQQDSRRINPTTTALKL